MLSRAKFLALVLAGVAFVLFALPRLTGVSGAGVTPSTTAPVVPAATTTVAPVTTVPFPASEVQACAYWSRVWPSVDEITLNGDLAALSVLVARGGPGGRWWQLNTWAAGRLASGRPTPLSDAVDALANAISAPGASPLKAIRSDAVAANAACS